MPNINKTEKLKWNESVRLRPGMYIGSINNRGFIGMIKSISSNFLTQLNPNSVQLSLLKENKAELVFDNLQKPILDDCVIAHTNPIKWLNIELGA